MNNNTTSTSQRTTTACIHIRSWHALHLMSCLLAGLCSTMPVPIVTGPQQNMRSFFYKALFSFRYQLPLPSHCSRVYLHSLLSFLCHTHRVRLCIVFCSYSVLCSGPMVGRIPLVLSRHDHTLPHLNTCSFFSSLFVIVPHLPLQSAKGFAFQAPKYIYIFRTLARHFIVKLTVFRALMVLDTVFEHYFHHVQCSN